MAYLRPPNTILAGNGLKQNPPAVPLDPSGLLPVNLDADIASKTNLGVVRVGDGIDVTPDGTISVTFPSPEHPCRAILVSTDYAAQPTDYYIGVNSTGPTKIFLPENPEDCIQLVIKADMGPPLGTRKVTIIPQGISTIDGDTTHVLTIPYESINLISQGGNWHVI